MPDLTGLYFYTVFKTTYIMYHIRSLEGACALIRLGRMKSVLIYI